MIGKRATVNVPGQRGANITMCAAISTDGLLLHRPLIGPYYTECLISFLDEIYGIVVPGEAMDAMGRHQPTFIIVWNIVAFHDSFAVTEWFAWCQFPSTFLSIPQHHRGIIFLIQMEGLPPSTCLNVPPEYLLISAAYCICVGGWCIHTPCQK